MACTSLVALPRACGAEGIVAGIDRLYILAYNDAASPAGVTNGDIYTVGVSGLVDDIGMQAGKSFVEIGLLRSTAGVTEELTKNLQTGSSYLTQTLTVVLADMTQENKAFVESVLNQPVVVVMRSRTSKFFAAGLNGSLELSALTGGTGTAEDDLAGYTLTFTAIDGKLIPGVDPTLIQTLITPTT